MTRPSSPSRSASRRTHPVSGVRSTARSRPSPDDVLVELELSAEGRWVAEYYPCEAVSDLPDGRLRAVLRTPDTGWVRRLALRLGEDGRVISPSELAAEIRDAATAALANYVA